MVNNAREIVQNSVYEDGYGFCCLITDQIYLQSLRTAVRQYTDHPCWIEYSLEADQQNLPRARNLSLTHCKNAMQILIKQ